MSDILKSSLLDLLYELRNVHVPLILGGGYGLYLKQIQLQEIQTQRTLLPGEYWPSPRSTQDLDFFLPTEIVADYELMKQLRLAIDRLGYVPHAKYLQFIKPVPQGGGPKIDFLTGPIPERLLDRVKISDMRVRPKTDSKAQERKVELHAFLTQEALNLDDSPVSMEVKGERTNGEPYVCKVFIPHSFTYLLLKLFAFRDRKAEANKDLARHHALDLYRIVAMLTEEEYDKVKDLMLAQKETPVIQEARRIVSEDFSSTTSLGALRLGEYKREQYPMLDISEFLKFIHEIFG